MKQFLEILNNAIEEFTETYGIKKSSYNESTEVETHVTYFKHNESNISISIKGNKLVILAKVPQPGTQFNDLGPKILEAEIEKQGSHYVLAIEPPSILGAHRCFLVNPNFQVESRLRLEMMNILHELYYSGQYDLRVEK